MRTLSPEQVRLTIDVARQVVERLAPDEIDLFPVYSAAFEQDPGSFDVALRSGNAERALGFDPGEVASLAITGLVFPIVTEIIMEVYKVRRAKAASKNLVIPESSLKTIRQRAYELARKTPMGDDQAAQLSNDVVELILQSSASPESE
jgi:hypothetical protein